MIDPRWVFLSMVFSLIGALRYAYLTLRGRVRPNLVSWSLWAAAPLIGFLAQLDAGVGMPALQTLASGLAPLLVLVSGLVSRHGRVRLSAFDLSCGGVALVAIVVWLALGNAPLAVLFAIAADAIAAIPTLIKAWRDPRSENASFYALIGAGSIVTLCTVASWRPEVWGFSAYILVLCTTLICVILGRRAAAVR
ncbi:hypothetical protein JD276_02925 [Leucobacter sp. CSA1]|uniref:Uncharacterized protein n=1 Tax=Leucobacter chromiisoli TaxID=2796471 RepID=A0A934Q5Y0_9MICO|nr:hypothetical protein [Leucobacter chromiisoli]MBK0417988.1 hypothetical protein [Leucobacter chromiisoli]